MRNGLAILSFASGILPDGLIFDLPDCDSVPDPAHLSDLFSSIDSEIILYLAIPPRQDQGLDCDQGGGSNARYSAVQRTLRDDSVGQGESTISFARKNLALVSEARLAADAISFPIARVFRDGQGGFASDPNFIPPCLRISASESLVLLLHRLAQAIEEKIVSTRNQRQGSGGFELGTSALDVANYWFLHALGSSLPALRHHLQDRRSHPEDVYRDLARLAGALSTFALESTQEEIPSYRHRDLTSTFKEMDALIRRYLEVVSPSNSVTLQFRKADSYIYVADVKDERCFRRSRWIFGVRSSTTDSVILRQTPKLVKVCSAEGVTKLVQRALPGLELMHVPVPPAALHAQADMHYFSVSLSGACWQHILQTKQVGVYIPGDLGDATFDLTIIMEAS
ncbi:MAG: type VI secretion system baseplate subunit TssK, partial [Terracidiphilus sp.]